MKPVLCIVLLFNLMLVLSACSDTQPVAPTASASAPTELTPPSLTAIPTARAARPTPRPSPIPLFDRNASPVPAPSATQPEISIDELDHPLSIEVMRKQAYPGSPITIEEVLQPGINYARYYVSYISEGLKIYALMTVPYGERPLKGWPVVVFNHGYIPPAVYRTTERYVEYVDQIARSGYLVFRSDYRGHDRSEGSARGAYGYPDYTIDVLNAVASLKTYPEADPERIGMWGHSMGGYITLRAMVISKDIQAGVIWAGVVASYPEMVNDWNFPAADTPLSESGWRTSLTATYGQPAENPVFWDAISANSYLGDLSGPIQLHHGTADVEVPWEFSESLYQQVLITRTPAELYLYENDNHNLSNSFSLAMQRSIQFFDTYLKNNP